mmetsp:Transcript_64570/g.140568  ORF Transcript_64570/g.140568 Transcript_64570/m.140568 type:complete len:87 (+) Transcript_64570:233-493(+)
MTRCSRCSFISVGWALGGMLQTDFKGKHRLGSASAAGFFRTRAKQPAASVAGRTVPHGSRLLALDTPAWRLHVEPASHSSHSVWLP